MRKVMCFGTFDKIHEGHKSYLQQARTQGDYLVVVVSRDSNSIDIKGKIPHNKEDVRLANMKQLSVADKVILGDVEDMFKVIKEELPDVIFFGYDQVVPIENLTFELMKLPKKIVMMRGKSLEHEEFKKGHVE